MPEHWEASVGKTAANIDTPALVIDLDAMERNLERMATFARNKSIKLRPHAKMHKSAVIARLQMSAGAVGVCVQKTEEAEALAAAGVTDIYISNEVVAPAKLARVAALSERMAAAGGCLSIAVDSAIGVDNLEQAMRDRPVDAKPRALPHKIDVLVEIDVGAGRCGVAPGEVAVELASRVVRCTGLRFAGLQAYNGKAQHARSRAERQNAIAQVEQAVRSTVNLLRAAAIDVPLVTGAGTGCFGYESASGAYGELQVGSYLFMDADYARNEIDPEYPSFEHALLVKTQVMSVSRNHVVCDAGHKSHAIDSGMPKILGHTELEYKVGGDEHGIIIGRDASSRLPMMGETLWLVPGHCDPTVNLHDYMIGVRGPLATAPGSARIERIIAVDARGALR